MALNKTYYEYVDIRTMDCIQIWGSKDGDGGIVFRVNFGDMHHLDEDSALQARVLGALLRFYQEGHKAKG